ncbi:hypothetical protein SK128_016643 [Halocaridina rubra]|uniref:Uncharacterized protein n=1 Tax=Halocaridina rubra TaxID=373956 RepID=A0AAN8WVV9_HALRR
MLTAFSENVLVTGMACRKDSVTMKTVINSGIDPDPVQEGEDNWGFQNDLPESKADRLEVNSLRPDSAVSVEEYVDVDTGKVVKQPTPCCGCRTFDHRFPLDMDDETAYVYREAKYCKLSYSFISAWCLMFLFATIASSGIIAVGFLDEKLVQYQVIGIVLTIIFGAFLPVFFVFWVCLRRRVREVRQEYRAQKNRTLVFEREMDVSLGGKDGQDMAKDKMRNGKEPASPSPPPSLSELDAELLLQ